MNMLLILGSAMGAGLLVSRGARAVKPSASWLAKESTFTTTPSMS